MLIFNILNERIKIMTWENKALFTLILVTQLSANLENNESKRFTTITFNQQSILQDNHSKLEWVNGKTDNNQTQKRKDEIIDGYISFKTDINSNYLLIKEKAEKYCKSLTFASYKDWRVPNNHEYQTLIQEIMDKKIPLNKNNASCNNSFTLQNQNKLDLKKSNQENTIICLRCVRDAEEPLTP